MGLVPLDSGIEVNVPATQSVIETLADRIERAYRRRRADWRGLSSSPRVWAIAAETLLRARDADRTLPLDPELFVASQPCDSPVIDPWRELTGSAAIGCYSGRVAEIILGLNGELAEEVRYAEDRVARGEAVARVLLSRNRRVSPLGRYIVARRAGRPVLANRFVQGALDQHRACPLYRRACAEWLPDGAYPEFDPVAPASGLDLPAGDRVRGLFHWN